MATFQPGYSPVSGEVRHASKLPLFVAIGLLLIGIASIPLAFALESRALFIVGYVATPVLTLMCVAWDSLAQRKGSRDIWFSIDKKLSLFVRIVAMVSFVPAAIQIWQIANWLGQIAVQNGWFQ